MIFVFMFWKQIKEIPDKRFKRLTGVKKDVFHQMKQTVEEYQEKHRKHPTRGKPPKLGVEDKLLVMLMYYREYRTYEHIGITYGISKSRVCEIIQTMENILIADKRFHLPGKKKLLEADSEIEVVLIDVAETPIERPKKNSGSITAAKRKSTH
jgi:Helix-turn-helix of DDE superfamily endonuclease